MLYLTVISLDPTGGGRQRRSNRWKKALNAFEITFDGRLSTHRLQRTITPSAYDTKDLSTVNLTGPEFAQ